MGFEELIWESKIFCAFVKEISLLPVSWVAFRQTCSLVLKSCDPNQFLK
jgi:hypothetical protein